MAEKISKEIFSTLGWTIVGPLNMDWECSTLQHQSPGGRGTHPSDVVFRYEDPYSNQTIFVNTDLKSYGKTSIKRSELIKTINSLAQDTDCTRRSRTWQERFVPAGIQYTTVGMLFIYNHDNQYENDFRDTLISIDSKSIDIAPDLQLFVFGPEDVLYLLNLVYDMEHLKYQKIIPTNSECRFFYPQLIRKRAHTQYSKTLTIDALTSPWQIYTFDDTEQQRPIKGRVVYARSKGASADEFKYIFDYLFRFQLIDSDTRIIFRFPYASREAPSIFNSAIESYVLGLPAALHIHSLLKKISFDPPNRMVNNFNAEAIGMEMNDD
ncbi:hypothetical protein [Myxococcus sp. AB025B]|uniref:hypothetical protein n=1 Tax=Myxococcus sp. AB025B TaxID=2562794 RepID=UPI0011430AFA|nr:hypothetical protein [Myxococcus sp. AB025B]